eukprot:6197417-Pleurochrysis_carterae.AAC.1
MVLRVFRNQSFRISGIASTHCGAALMRRHCQQCWAALLHAVKAAEATSHGRSARATPAQLIMHASTCCAYLYSTDYMVQESTGLLY